MSGLLAMTLLIIFFIELYTIHFICTVIARNLVTKQSVPSISNALKVKNP